MIYNWESATRIILGAKIHVGLLIQAWKGVYQSMRLVGAEGFFLHTQGTLDLGGRHPGWFT